MKLVEGTQVRARACEFSKPIRGYIVKVNEKTAVVRIENTSDCDKFKAKTKSGVEIFEGDIAETRKSDLSNTPFEMVGGVVTYDSDYGMFKLVRKYGSKFHPFTIWLTNVEVIGNIHANPELLNSGIE